MPLLSALRHAAFMLLLTPCWLIFAADADCAAADAAALPYCYAELLRCLHHFAEAAVIRALMLRLPAGFSSAADNLSPISRHCAAVAMPLMMLLFIDALPLLRHADCRFFAIMLAAALSIFSPSLDADIAYMLCCRLLPIAITLRRYLAARDDIIRRGAIAARALQITSIRASPLRCLRNMPATLALRCRLMLIADAADMICRHLLMPPFDAHAAARAERCHAYAYFDATPIRRRRFPLFSLHAAAACDASLMP